MSQLLQLIVLYRRQLGYQVGLIPFQLCRGFRGQWFRGVT